MSRLLLVEVRRVAARRLVRVVVALLLVGLAVIVTVGAARSNRDVAGARAEAARQAAELERFAVECEKDKEAGRIPAEVECASTEEQYFRDPRFSFVTRGGDWVTAGVGMATAAAVLIAIGALGAEWAAGTFAGLLLWEPRRIRVLTAKIGSVVAVGVALAGSAAVLMLTAAWIVAATRGTTAGATRHVIEQHALIGVRGMALAALLTTLAAALANLLRSTAGTLGLLAGYLIAAEMVLRGLRAGSERWLLSSNIGALVSGGIPLFGSPPATDGGGEPFTLTAGRAALVLLGPALAAAAVSATVLRRRDVT